MNAEQLKIVLDQLTVVQEILVIAQADAAAESVKQTSQTLSDWHALLVEVQAYFYKDGCADGDLFLQLAKAVGE